MRQLQTALSRWDNEGGASAHHPRGQERPASENGAMASTGDELDVLRSRLVALENLMVVFLAQASDRQIMLARETAIRVSLQPDAGAEAAMVDAAARIVRLIERADHFRIMTSA